MKYGRIRLRVSMLIFVVCVLFSFTAWDHYYNSRDLLSPVFFSSVVLAMGLLFSVVAGLLVWAIESRGDYLEKELMRREKQLIKAVGEHKLGNEASVAIFWLSQVIFSKPNVPALLETTMDLVKNILKADEGSLMLLDEDGRLYIAQSSGISKDVIKNTRIRLGERVAGKIAQLRREYLLQGDLKKYPEFEHLESNSKIKSSIGCPLVCHDQLLGVMNLNRTTNNKPFNEPDLRYAMIFASQVAQVLWNSKLDNNIDRRNKQIEMIHKTAEIMRTQLGSS